VSAESERRIRDLLTIEVAPPDYYDHDDGRPRFRAAWNSEERPSAEDMADLLDLVTTLRREVNDLSPLLDLTQDYWAALVECREHHDDDHDHPGPPHPHPVGP
jgi:hypothetical protein